MTFAPLPLDELPPSNSSAFGLHLTDKEFQILIDLLNGEPTIKRAVVYGSRQTGVRRRKLLPEPLDIDLAIEVTTRDSDDYFTEFFHVSQRLKAILQLRIQAEDLTDTESPHYSARKAGILIFERKSKD